MATGRKVGSMYDIAHLANDGALPAGLQNFRDLGGIATVAGERIRHGVVYRSDAPRAGDPAPGALPGLPRR